MQRINTGFYRLEGGVSKAVRHDKRATRRLLQLENPKFRMEQDSHLAAYR